MRTYLRQETDPKFYTPRVCDLMTRDLITLREYDTVTAWVDLMRRNAIRHVPVVDDEKRLIGLVTQRDYLTIAVSKLAHIPQPEQEDLNKHLRVGEVMGRKVATVSPYTPASEAAELMFRNKYGCLPVVENGKLVGILTEADFLKVFMTWNTRFREA